MHSFRPADSKYYLSGGWTDIREDPQFLHSQNVKAVLDLQYTLNDDIALPMAVKDALSEFNIEYTYYPFDDTDDYPAKLLEESFNEMHEILTEWEIKYNKKSDHILIKCGAGISRSPAAYLYHVCTEQAASYRTELWRLRDYEEGWIEFGASPNQGFDQFLMRKFPPDDYESIFK